MFSYLVGPRHTGVHLPENVIGEMLLATEAFTANFAAEWILVSMRALMVCQMLFPRIFLTTHIALMRCLT